MSHCARNRYPPPGRGELRGHPDNCRRAIAPDGRLLVIEAVVSTRDEPALAKILDLVMLEGHGGEKLSEEENRAFVAEGGSRLTRKVTTRAASATLIEAVPV